MTTHLFPIKLYATYLLGCLVALSPVSADMVTLYAPTGNETLSSQGFGYITNPPFLQDATSVGSASGTTLTTSLDQGESAGFFTHNPFNGTQFSTSSPVLDRLAGFDIQFELALSAEAHSTTNRGGFSMIVIASDGKGIELAFWADEIWAYEDGSTVPADLFTHAEGIAQTPAAMQNLRRYDLTLYQNSYRLSIDGVSSLTGTLRDYSSWVGPSFPGVGELDPYEAPNMIFLGDDTSSASCTAIIGMVTVTTASNEGVTLLDHGLNANTLSIDWESLTGLSYVVEQSTTLSSASWSLMTPLSASETMSNFSTTLPNIERSFYRVRLTGF